MQIRGRALYNLLQLTHLDVKRDKVKPWQIESYRNLTDDQLLQRLHHLKIFLDLDSFIIFAGNSNSPEDLLQYLVSNESNREKAEQVYLIIFELWRRHLSHKHALSIFCDELDFLMSTYDSGDLSNVDDLYAQLIEFCDLFDESLDAGQSVEMIYSYFTSYLAHDVDHFVYDFSSDLIRSHNETAASEIIDRFEDYSPNKLQYDFLKLKLLFTSDAFDTEAMLSRFAEQIIEEKNGNLGLDFLRFLLEEGEFSHFFKFFFDLLKLISNQGQFSHLAKIAMEYTKTLDKRHKHRLILDQSLEKKRAEL
ncbi:MAG: hypothetical protein K9M07_02010 [Simkaniaceae bacterium]|nr:hypothetical protein [Simkaniaceae bacterium]